MAQFSGSFAMICRATGAFARRALRQGELIPFPCTVVGEGEGGERSGFSFTLDAAHRYARRGNFRRMVANGRVARCDPHPRAAAGYVNDWRPFADRSPTSMAACRARQNVEAVSLYCERGIWHIFWRTLRPIGKDELLWGDYGEAYWATPWGLIVLGNALVVLRLWWGDVKRD